MPAHQCTALRAAHANCASPTTPVTLLRSKFVRGWPRHEIGGSVEVVDLLDALEQDYATDAHIALYASRNGRRLTTEALDRGLPIAMHAVAFDLDCPATHGSGVPAPESWRRDIRERVAALAADHPSPYYYETRGGARIVYRLPEATLLRTQEDARVWAQDYAITIAYVRRRYGIDADPSCADWQRLFRLPHVTRAGGVGPENWPTWGGPDMVIGQLRIGATTQDMRDARAASRAFGERPLPPFTGRAANGGTGLLYHLILARGDLGPPHGDGYIVRCPNEHNHSTGRAGDSSTLLYPPSDTQTLGAIHCLHSHCAALRAADWLAMFGDEEIARASRAAGLYARRRA